MMHNLWVARLDISPRTERKIIDTHRITPREVRDEVECVPGLDYVWHYHQERGWRAIVKTYIRGRRAFVVLYEADDPFGDVYNLGSAYFAQG